MKTPRKYLLLSGLLLLAVACSVEKNTATTRLYHSVTAHYNIYFNGYESFKAGVVKVEASYMDDYAEMLDLFEYSDPTTASVCGTDMDNAISKSSKLIRLKSITALPEEKERERGGIDPDEALLSRKEFNEWVDDAYLLIGKANFYKHLFPEAYSIFTYCVEQANDEEIKKEATIWIARGYIEQGDYINGNRILSDFIFSDDLPKSIKELYYTTLADLRIKQKRYSEAIEPLESAIELTHGKREKYRYTFLLAQLNQETGNGQDAVQLYEKVVKLSPPYEVEFNSRINTASAIEAGSNDVGSTKRTLERMLKDTKNTEYTDQIYYALGNLAMKDNNPSEAIEHYQKSVATQLPNTNQKGRSYLALADYFYGKEELIKAGTYYDSAVFFLNQRYSDYQEIKKKSDNLNAVVAELRVILEQDSLQRIAAMPVNERTTFINGIIAKLEEEEREANTASASDQYNLGQFYENERRFSENIEQEGSWYFYNQTALTFGRTEFKRLYGSRGLEDNWRRSNKTVVTAAQEDSGEVGANNPDGAAVGGESVAVADNKRPEYYLRNLPLNDTLLVFSNNKIANAYLNAGKAYAERFADPITASEYLEMLTIRYPEHVLVPEALYNLYQINKNPNPTKAETYRQRLLQLFPETEYAKILSDPDYYARKMAESKQVELLYQQVFGSFNAGNMAATISGCDSAISQYPEDPLVAKFMLLKAYAIASSGDERSYKEELNKLIALYPSGEEGKKAKEIVDFLNKENPQLLVEENIEVARELYIKEVDNTLTFALIIENPAFNINLANFDVISFNIDNYTNKNYRTQGELTDNKYIIITVSGFTSYEEALSYYSAFDVAKVMRNPSGDKIYTFLISQRNMATLATDKKPERYLLFFQENYLQ